VTSRRRFIATTTAAILAAPLSAEAQQVERVYRVGVLLTELSAAVTSHLQAFRERLRELGYVEGQNLVVDVKSLTDPAGGRDGLATELVRWRTDVIVAWGTPATLLAKQATTTIPIIMVSVADPVGPGLVATLSRPGANITGISNLSRELSGKQLELLRELRPRVNRFAVLRNVGNPASAFQWRETETAARAVGVKLQLVEVGQAKELEGAVATMVR
jgi:putative tryptophan/tyrosine transport system substrate-binding protein